jgi:hypothetical protein
VKKQIIDDVAENLGRIYELLNTNIKIQEKIIKSAEDNRSPFDSSGESLPLIEYSKGYLKDT